MNYLLIDSSGDNNKNKPAPKELKSLGAGYINRIGPYQSVWSLLHERDAALDKVSEALALEHVVGEQSQVNKLAYELLVLCE